MKEFEAEIIGHDSGGAYIVIPFDVEQEFGKKRPKVKVTFDGVLYRGTLVRYGTPFHILIIRKDIRAKVGKEAGDMISVTIEQDLEKRTVTVPEDLQKAMIEHPEVVSFFNNLAYTYQKEYVKWIEGAKREATRLRRIDKAIEMMKEGKKGV